MVEIHNCDKQYAYWEQRIRNSWISPRNKELILQYRDQCVLHGVCGKVRLMRAFQVLARVSAMS